MSEVRFKVIAYFFLIILSGEIILSCTNRPKEVLNRKKMEQLMYDIYVAESIIENDYATFDTPEKKEALINEVFRKHGITPSQWDTSLSWYSDHVDIYLKMNDSVKSRLKREQLRIEQLISQEYSREQELNRRNRSRAYIPTSYVFGLTENGSGFSFQLSKSEIDQYDSANLDFHFETIGIPAKKLHDIQSMLILEYKDTVIYRSASVSSNAHYSLPISKYIANDTLQSASGFVKMRKKPFVPSFIQVYNIALEERSQEKQRFRSSDISEKEEIDRVIFTDSIQ